MNFSRVVECVSPWCENVGKRWVVHARRIQDGLHEWPDVLCDGCGCTPAQITRTSPEYAEFMFNFT